MNLQGIAHFFRDLPALQDFMFVQKESTFGKQKQFCFHLFLYIFPMGSLWGPYGIPLGSSIVWGISLAGIGSKVLGFLRALTQAALFGAAKLY